MGEIYRDAVVKRPMIRAKLRASKKSTHKVLVNKTTGKVSSSSKRLRVEAAKAFQKGETSGLPGLLAIHGGKWLIHNKIVTKKMRVPVVGHVNQQVRDQAKNFIVVLAVLYEKVMKKHKPPRRKDFAKWVASEMKKNRSEAVLRASAEGYHELIDAKRSSRWWLDLLEKMQS